MNALVRVDERADGPTFALDRIGWIDFETRSPCPITAGAYRYATEADAIVLSWAIGAGPVRRVSVRRFPATLDMVDLPTGFLAHHARVMNGTAVWAAWNAGFDRAVWNYAAAGFPVLEPHHVIDVMAQAAASGLPSDLEAAAKASGSMLKSDGSALIKLFCAPGSTGTPQSHPAEWQAFLAYADQDIAAMRSVFLRTRQLPLAEWREYWAMEAVNARGVAIDLPMVTAAAALAEEDKIRSREELRRITGDPKMTVDMVARLTAWLLDRLSGEGRAILTRRVEETEDGVVTRPARFALTRRQVERLIVCVEEQGGAEIGHVLHPLLRLLQIRLYGGSKTPAKFARMLASHVGGRLYGQYVFNGAAQTGRASSRGVQVHNLARDTLADEPAAVDVLLNGATYDALAGLGVDTPVARKLSLLIRPAFVPSGDNVFVWSDWSQIEARVLPWLAGAQARLDVFRAVDADPSAPDLYTRTAAVLSHVPLDQVTRPIRQRGKVAELALGFAGGVGSLQSMGAGYGLHVSDAEARQTVDTWRAANPWCVRFWEALEEAVDLAIKMPGLSQPVGRLVYVFVPQYLGGSLFCTLPSGRTLTYRNLYREQVEEKDDDGNVTGYKRRLRFSRGRSRVELWRGILCENVVQAVAADVLRGTLRRLVDGGHCVRLHTHDEILLECARADVALTIESLRHVMRRGFSWSEGLPLMSEETTGYCYTKHEGSHGL